MENQDLTTNVQPASEETTNETFLAAEPETELTASEEETTDCLCESGENKKFKINLKIKLNLTKKRLLAIIAGLLALLLICNIFLCVVSLCNILPSSDNTEQAYKNAKEAYGDINEAYKKVNDFSHDIYIAWYKGINNESKLTPSSYSNSRYDNYWLECLKYLCKNMKISYKDISQGVLYAYYGEDNYKSKNKDSNIATAYKNIITAYKDEDSLFSACVNIVTSTYKVMGYTDTIKTLLSDAKKTMKQMSKEYSDYIHYSDLKDYLTLTLSFFDFCSKPEGSFEQVVETFNAYRNDRRTYYFSLEYILK